MFILDTNVVSELRRAASGNADKNVVRWAARVPPGELYLSVVTVLELEIGVLLVERLDPAQGKLLRRWITEQVQPAFEGRVLDIDTVVAQRCARLHVPDPRSERDALIAATALVHGMTVATRNVADFELLNVPLVNPWSSKR